jgi:hypothetical protein
VAVKLNGKPSPISAVLDTFERVGNDNRDTIVVHCQKKMEINHVKVEILNEPVANVTAKRLVVPGEEVHLNRFGLDGPLLLLLAIAGPVIAAGSRR